MKTWQAILGGGLTAGLVDIIAPMTIYRVGPMPVLKTIASGWIGKAAAHEGGAGVAALGLASHLAISLVFAAFYVLVSRRLPVLTHRPLLCGAAYGVGVYLVMNYLVVPLSAAHGHAPADPKMIGLNLLAMIVFGLIIAQFAARAPSPASASVAPQMAAT